jgi:hypothetical protein
VLGLRCLAGSLLFGFVSRFARRFRQALQSCVKAFLGIVGFRFTGRVTELLDLRLFHHGEALCSLGQKAKELRDSLWEVSRRTDTAYVIVSATILEDLLEQALLANMRALSNTAYRELFRGYGPLRDFRPKIDLAFALKIIDQEAKTEFHIIREIRNKFAHAVTIAHFEKAELEPVFQKLTGWKKGIDTQKLFDAQIVWLSRILSSHVDQSIFEAIWRGEGSQSHSPINLSHFFLCAAAVLQMKFKQKRRARRDHFGRNFDFLAANRGCSHGSLEGDFDFGWTRSPISQALAKDAIQRTVKARFVINAKRDAV